jgi:hypothetical protein
MAIGFHVQSIRQFLLRLIAWIVYHYRFGKDLGCFKNLSRLVLKYLKV